MYSICSLDSTKDHRIIWRDEKAACFPVIVRTIAKFIIPIAMTGSLNHYAIYKSWCLAIFCNSHLWSITLAFFLSVISCWLSWKKKAGRLRKALQLFSYTYIWSLQHYPGYVYKIFLDSNVPSNCIFTDGIYRNKSQNSPWEESTFFPPKISFLLSKIIFIVTSYLNTKWYTYSKVICILCNQFHKYFINVGLF